MACTTNYRHLLRFTLYFPLLSLAACTIPARVTGTDYVHLVYQHAAQSRVDHAKEPLTLVFIEGDGVPWVAGGMRPATDPTPIHALAFNLYKHSSQAAWYITRPCYNGVKDAACTSRIWTHARYSEQVVTSMATALNRFALEQDVKRLVLVGYSGGGTLAMLLADRVPNVAGIITIAANLDVAAWTELHGYEALDGSLNPADMTELAIPHIALVGDLDRNVPLLSINRFLKTHPHTVVQHYQQYDHVCCWERNGSALLDTALVKLNIDH